MKQVIIFLLLLPFIGTAQSGPKPIKLFSDSSGYVSDFQFFYRNLDGSYKLKIKKDSVIFYKAIKIASIDSLNTPVNLLWLDPSDRKLKIAAAPTTTIDAAITTAVNSGTSETDLFTKTTAANTLNTDKQTLNFEADGEFNDATATAQLKLYFAGNVTLNTGAINISTAPTAWRLRGYIIRTSSTTAHLTYELQCPGLATPLFIGYSNLTSLDFTTTNILKITAQAGGGGGGTGDISAHSWQVTYRPQP